MPHETFKISKELLPKLRNWSGPVRVRVVEKNGENVMEFKTIDEQSWCCPTCDMGITNHRG